MSENDTPTGVGERLATIETKLDMLIVRRDDHESRLRSLEKWRWLWAGAAGALGGTASKLLPMIGG